MLVNCVTVYVKPEFIQAFTAETIVNHQASVQEPGNLRFDVLQCLDTPGRFFLYEAWKDESAAKAHKDTPHYKKWREAVEPMMARPREGISHTVIAPGPEGFCK